MAAVVERRARNAAGVFYSTGRKWAYTRGVKRYYTLHHVDRSLALLRDCGLLRPGEIRNEFVLPDDALDEARRFFRRGGSESGQTHAVHPAVHQLAV